ncbi:MAG: hypothetical protein H6737_14820 [Alphaproteobacteria bacterium]|nr:hypothetical protein [Alphaproteobacteria bacterium]
MRALLPMLTLLAACPKDDDLPEDADTDTDTDTDADADTDADTDADVPPDPSPEAVTAPTLKIRLWEGDRYVVSLLSPASDHGVGIVSIDNAQVACADGSTYAFNTELFYLLEGDGSSQFQGGGNQAFYYVDPDTTYENQGSASTDLFWFGCDVTNPQVTGTFNTTLTMEDGTVYEQGAIERIDL